ncbi:MAG: DUF11 domain-containing protein [Verrucomicrobiales bacterium]|nr:DUF11 domain-containing protein [Verrucomicrobiales bacterium]
MRPNTFALLGLALAFLALGAPRAAAQQHRATRLGDPETRFAPPLRRPEDLRRLLLDEKLKADVDSVLQQAKWPGNPEDLRRAAATAPIQDVRVAPGTRLPFMSTRRGGKAIALMDVLWAGKQPFEAFQFEFASKGQRYRCLTPKPCSNFLVIHLGREVDLELTKSAPPEANLCDPFEMTITVRNTGLGTLSQVKVIDSLPPGLRTMKGDSTLTLDAGTLAPGGGTEFKFPVVASAAGVYENKATVTTAEGGTAEALASTTVHAPSLQLACTAPANALINRPVEVCLTVTNSGDAPDPKVTLQLPIPAGTTLAGATLGGTATGNVVVWELGALDPHSARTACATFTSTQPNSLALAPTAQGQCSPPTQSTCATEVRGIFAILLEVIDLEDPVEVGHEVTYEIQVTNQGSSDGTQIKLVCPLPATQEFVSGSGPTSVRAEGSTVHIEPLAKLAPKEKATWRVVVKAVNGGDTRFQALLTSEQFARPIEEFEATEQY